MSEISQNNSHISEQQPDQNPIDRLKEKVDYFQLVFDNKLPEIYSNNVYCNEQVKEYKEQLHNFEERCLRMETKLKYHNIQQPMMNYDWSEIKTRALFTEIFEPTQLRMLEIQDRFGVVCATQAEMKIEHKNMHKKMEEALGLGRSTLRNQIMSEIFKQFKSFEATIRDNKVENEMMIKQMKNEMRTFDNKLNIWQSVQNENANQIEKNHKEMLGVGEQLNKEISEQMERVQQQQSATQLQIQKLSDNHCSHQNSTLQKLKILDSFKQNLQENLSRIELNEKRMQQNEQIILDFKNDDIFQNAWKNYINIYQSIEQLRNDYNIKFEEIQHQQSHFSSVKQYNQVSDKILLLQRQILDLDLNLKEQDSKMKQSLESASRTSKSIPKVKRLDSARSSVQKQYLQIPKSPRNEVELKVEKRESELSLGSKKGDNEIDIKQTFNDYNSFSKRPVQCKFEPEMLDSYLHLDNATEYISEIVSEQLSDFEEQNEIKIQEMKTAINIFKSYVEQSFGTFQARINEKVNSQDDQNDVLACEIHNFAKKKADQDLKIEGLKQEIYNISLIQRTSSVHSLEREETQNDDPKKPVIRQVMQKFNPFLQQKLSPPPELSQEEQEIRNKFDQRIQQIMQNGNAASRRLKSAHNDCKPELVENNYFLDKPESPVETGYDSVLNSTINIVSRNNIELKNAKLAEDITQVVKNKIKSSLSKRLSMVRDHRQDIRQFNNTATKKDKNLGLNLPEELDKILNLRSQRYSEGGNPALSPKIYSTIAQSKNSTTARINTSSETTISQISAKPKLQNKLNDYMRTRTTNNKIQIQSKFN